MTIRTIVFGCVAISLSGAAVAQGDFDFDDIPGVDEEPAFVVDLNPVLISWIRAALADVDPEGAEMLGGLRSVKLRVYHNGDNARQFNNFIDDITEELQDSGWHAVVSAQDEGSKVRMYMQMTEEEVSGMTVMAADATEAIFLNIDGSISAEDLGRVMALLPVQDVLGSLPVPPGAQAPVSLPTAD